MFIGVSSRLKCGFLLFSLTMIFYFSGTGNSAWVARQLASSLHEPLCEVVSALTDGAASLSIDAGTSVGFVFPVYSWGPPLPVLRLLASLRLSAAPSYLYFICTCGDDTGKTARVFSRAARRRGWQCKAGFSIILPNTYVCLPGFDVDGQELVRTKLAKAESRLSEVIAAVRARQEGFDCREGSLPWVKTYLIRPLFHRYLTSPRRFHVTEACVGCDQCARHCPFQNIRVEGRPRWGDRCTLCLSCYHHCPRKAIRYSVFTEGKGQYTFPRRSSPSLSSNG